MRPTFAPFACLAPFTLLPFLATPFAAVLAGSASAQEPAPATATRADAAKRAEARFRERDWAGAAQAYAEFADAAADVNVCHHFGYCLHALGRLDDAMVWHQRAAGLAAQDEVMAAKSQYNVACVHALQGRKAEAIAALERAVAMGFTNAAHIEHDPDLATVRDEPAVERLVADLERRARIVAIVVYDGVEILDWSGPAEVFSSVHGRGGEALCRVVLVAPQQAPIHCQRLTATVAPDYGIADCPQPDVIVVPGGSGALEHDPAFVAWLQRAASKATITMSVCTGAFVLADAGLLDGKRATTWHGALPGLEQKHPSVQVERGVRFVDNGAIVTAAGVSSGIPGALHVVERLFGADAAAATANYIEYDWRPGAPAAGDHGR